MQPLYEAITSEALMDIERRDIIILIHREPTQSTVKYIRYKRQLEYKQFLQRKRDTKYIEPLKNLVTERLHSNPIPSRMSRNSIHYSRLYSTAIIVFYLNEHTATSCYKFKDLIQCRNALIRLITYSIKQREFLQLCQRKSIDTSLAVSRAVDALVVHGNNMPIGRESHIDFHRIDAESYCTFYCHEAVFGPQRRTTPMRYDHRPFYNSDLARRATHKLHSKQETEKRQQRLFHTPNYRIRQSINKNKKQKNSKNKIIFKFFRHSLARFTFLIYFCNVKNGKTTFLDTKTFGEVAEWSIAPVLKTDVLRGTGGSNPSLSAERRRQKADKIRQIP